MSLRKHDEYLYQLDGPAFAEGYAHVTRMEPSKDGGLPFPWWHGWALRESFWEGVLWERERVAAGGPAPMCMGPLKHRWTGPTCTTEDYDLHRCLHPEGHDDACACRCGATGRNPKDELRADAHAL